MTATFTFLWLPNAVAQHADSLHLELDHVARLQPALVAVLEDAAGPDRARAEYVARPQLGVAPRVRDDRLPRVVHVAEVAARALLAVDARDHFQAQVAELVGSDEQWAERGGEVLALRRAEPDLHLLALEIARGPVVHDREAADRAVRPDHRRHLQLVVESLRALGVGDLLVGPEDRGRVGE